MSTRWANQTFLTKDMAADSGVDVDGYLDMEFRRTLPEGATVVEGPNYEWLDLNAPEREFVRQLMKEGGIETPENMWLVRGEASIEVPA